MQLPKRILSEANLRRLAPVSSAFLTVFFDITKNQSRSYQHRKPNYNMLANKFTKTVFIIKINANQCIKSHICVLTSGQGKMKDCLKLNERFPGTFLIISKRLLFCFFVIYTSLKSISGSCYVFLTEIVFVNNKIRILCFQEKSFRKHHALYPHHTEKHVFGTGRFTNSMA